MDFGTEYWCLWFYVIIIGALAYENIPPQCVAVERQCELLLPYRSTFKLDDINATAVLKSVNDSDALDCHGDFYFLLCAVINPNCTEIGENLLLYLPCKDICEEVLDQCSSNFMDLAIYFNNETGCDIMTNIGHPTEAKFCETNLEEKHDDSIDTSISAAFLDESYNDIGESSIQEAILEEDLYDLGDSFNPESILKNEYEDLRDTSISDSAPGPFVVSCGDILTVTQSDGVEIKSSNYPSNYSDNEDCSWRVTGPDDGQLLVEFIDFFIEYGYDFLSAGNGLDIKNGAVISNHSGEDSPDIFISFDNKVWIHFTSDDSNTERGFWINVSYIQVSAGNSTTINTVGSCLGNCGNNASDCYCDSVCTKWEDCCSDYLTFCSAESSTPITPTAAIPTGRPITTQNENHPTTPLMTTTTVGGCGGYLTSESGDITSENYPSDYPPDSVCVWIIEVSPTATISISFNDFNLEYGASCSYDYIQIRDGNSSTATELGRYCGTSLPSSSESSGNTMYIYFASDGSEQDSGFSLSYKLAIPPTCSSNEFTCDDGSCINNTQVCDDNFDCPGDSYEDESACTTTTDKLYSKPTTSVKQDGVSLTKTEEKNPTSTLTTKITAEHTPSGQRGDGVSLPTTEEKKTTSTLTTKTTVEPTTSGQKGDGVSLPTTEEKNPTSTLTKKTTAEPTTSGQKGEGVSLPTTEKKYSTSTTFPTKTTVEPTAFTSQGGGELLTTREGKYQTSTLTTKPTAEMYTKLSTSFKPVGDASLTTLAGKYPPSMLTTKMTAELYTNPTTAFKQGGGVSSTTTDEKYQTSMLTTKTTAELYTTMPTTTSVKPGGGESLTTTEGNYPTSKHTTRPTADLYTTKPTTYFKTNDDVLLTTLEVKYPTSALTTKTTTELTPTVSAKPSGGVPSARTEGKYSTSTLTTQSTDNVCESSEYKCKDNTCIRSEFLCNSIEDCEDDENDCFYDINLEISCSHNCDYDHVNPNDTLIIGTICQDCTREANFIWTVKYYDGLQWITLDEESTKTGLTSADLAIKSGMREGTSYHVEVQVSDGYGYGTGINSLNFTTNSPPYGGTCQSSDEEGEALSDKFTFNCSGWKSEVGGLGYKFFYQIRGSEEVNLLPTTATATSEDNFLPNGNSIYDYAIDIIVNIIDQYQSTAEYTFKLKVSEVSFSDEEIKDELSQLTTNNNSTLNSYLKSGDISSGLALGTTVMGVINSDTDKGDGSQLSIIERKELREEMAAIILATSSNLNGSGEISQSITLIKAITKEPSEMSSRAMEESAFALRNAAESLKDISGKTTETILNIAQDWVDGVDNLFKATRLNEDSLDNTVANSLTEAFKDLTTTVADSMSPGEETEINTDSVKIKVGKNRKQDMGDKTISSSSGSNVKLPSADTLFGSGDDSAVISSELVGLENIPYVDGMSDQLNGESLSFGFKFENGTAISMTDLPDIIIIQIPSPGSSTDPLDSVSTNKVDDDNYLYIISAIVRNEESLLLKLIDIQSCQMGLNVSIAMLNNVTNPSLDKQPYTDSQECPERGGNVSFVIEKENFNSSGVENKIYYFGIAQKVPIEMKIQSFSAQCRVWNKTAQQWTDDGLSVMSDSTPNVIHCGTNHLSTFASGASFYPPETINWDAVLSGFQNLGDNTAVFSTILVILAVYLAIIYFAWKADKSDNEKWSATILNTTQGENAYHYHLYVSTGVVGGADTCSKVFIILTGSKGNSEVICLNEGHIKERMIFSRGSVRQFLIAIPQSLGVLQTLRVWHDNSGILDKRSWYLSRMTVVDDEKQERYHFVCERWLALEKDDGRIERLLRIASESDLKKVKLMLSTNAHYNLNDAHIWFSVVSRPRRSRFTRVQRLSCCLSLLYCMMVANCMWYQQTKQQGNDVTINIGPIQLSWKSIQIGLMSSLVVFPINILIIQIFRKSSPRPKSAKSSSVLEVINSLPPDSRQAIQPDALVVEEEIEFELKKLRDEYTQLSDTYTRGAKDEDMVEFRSHDKELKAVKKGDVNEKTKLPKAKKEILENVSSSFSYNQINSVEVLPHAYLKAEQEVSQTNMNKTLENYGSKEATSYTHQSSNLKMENETHLMEVDKMIETRIRYSIQSKENKHTTTKQIPSTLILPTERGKEKSVYKSNLPTWDENTKKQRTIEERSSNSNIEGAFTVGEASAPSQIPHLQGSNKKRRTAFMLPYWCIYVAWILVILTCLVSAAFTVFYSMQWGAEDSNKWLLGFFISFFEDVILIQPIKVLMIAFIVTMMLKKYEGEDKDGEQVDIYFTESMEIDVSEDTLMTKDVDPEIIEKLKTQRRKEIEMKKIIKNIIIFLIFLGLLWFIAYGSRDSNAILINNGISNTLFENEQFSEITGNFENFYIWISNTLLPNVFVSTYYNGEALKGYELKLFSDLAAYKLGSTRLRQIRVKDICVPLKRISSQPLHCTVDYSEPNEDISYYGSQWSPFDPNDTSSYASIWQYKTADELSGLTTFGILKNYPGGGFVVDLGTTSTVANEAVDYIFNNKWLDEYTRAVFIEFNLYNPNVNLFSAVKVLLEYPSTGGAVVDTSIDIMQLSGYVGTFWIITLIIELIFLGFLLYYTIKEFITIWEMKISYFKHFWNILEALKIIACTTAAAFYILKTIERVTSLSEIGNNDLNSFTNLQKVVFYNEVYIYMLAFVVFSSTLKIWNLLEFNSLFRSLSLTLTRASRDIVYFLIIFFIAMFAFGHILYLAVGTTLYEYRSVWQSVQTLFSLLLGVFEFHELQTASGILGPIIFFLFSLLIYLILFLFFATIIIGAFKAVKNDSNYQKNHYEVLKFVKDNLRALMGMAPELEETDYFQSNRKCLSCVGNQQTVKSRKISVERREYSGSGVNILPRKGRGSRYDECERLQQRLNRISERIEESEAEETILKYQSMYLNKIKDMPPPKLKKQTPRKRIFTAE